MARTLSGKLTGAAARLDRLDAMTPTTDWERLYDMAKDADPDFIAWYKEHCGLHTPNVDEEKHLLEWHICDMAIAKRGNELRWQMEYELRAEDERDHRSETDYARYGY